MESVEPSNRLESRCLSCLKRESLDKRGSRSPKFKVERYYERFKQTNSTPQLTLVRLAKEKEREARRKKEEERQLKRDLLKAL